MRSKIFLFITLSVIMGIISCSTKDDPIDDPIPIKKESFYGYVQKGPFNNGTDITVAELTEELTQTGKIFSSRIIDNKGTFEIKNIELISPFVELKANGFYFNEVANKNSITQLTLFALADVTKAGDINVNVLSNLERDRIHYLVAEGKDFKEAKQQAQAEILSIFEIENENISDSEHLDISKLGDGNAALLAASVILQGYLPASELSELLADISSDIREDGVLNSATLGTTLINNARLINLEQIRENLTEKYIGLGLTNTVPAFEKFVNNFIENTDFEFTAFIEYPATGKHGLNILDPEKTSYTNGNYSMRAILPAGKDLRVRIGGKNWGFPGEQQETGWLVDTKDMTDSSRVFTSIRNGDIDFEIKLNDFGRPSSSPIKIDIYENEKYSWSKSIYIE